MTDLFAIASGVRADVVARAVPPSCLRGIDDRPALLESGPDCLVEAEWRPRARARHFVPSVSLLGSYRFSFRAELAVRIDGAWTPWVAATSIGPCSFQPMPTTPNPLTCDIDVFVSDTPAERVRVRVRFHGADRSSLMSTPWLVTLSASDLAGAAGSSPAQPSFPLPDRVSIGVPAISQMTEAEAIRHRICSPTGVAMVLGRWGVSVPPIEVAQDVFHPDVDRYGVWPAAILAAARRGIAGYLLRFPDWASAAWCLAGGLPVVASVRYAAGELTGAAIAQTDGHLLVLTGYDGDDVLVNDPAAPTRATVARRYRRDEIERVWLGRAGVGYVFFPPDGDLIGRAR